MVKVQKVRQLRPEQAAQFVLDNIVQDSLKRVKLQEIHISDYNLFYGNRILHEIYGVPMFADDNIIDASFKKHVSDHLGFELVETISKDDNPAITMMMIYLGQLARGAYKT